MPQDPRSAVDKALDLIEAVAACDRPARLTDLAQQVDLHRATAYRILLDLVRRGWVLRVGELYLPGAAVLQLSAAAARHSLAALARPVLEELARSTDLMVNLQVPESDRARVVDVVRPERLAMITHLRDEALPVHRFAGPLALVAALPPQERGPYLRPAVDAGHPLDGPDGLLADLARVERTGFALERGRHEKLVASISRAVLSDRGAPLCALTLVGPDAEFEEPRLDRLKHRLAAAADELSLVLRSPVAPGGPA
ncbi:IclR family transcriptional regulator [Kitasatospora sp. NPDC094015]|uniref:IclR family transcriptional regulator n=1 Tax=Kitasatospora sp. NPDC094015 TaxID=3155205 RepID=UPI00332B4B45